MLKYSLSFIPQSKNELYYLSAPCGSGKTKAICDKICSDWIFDKNILLVLPTIALIDDVSARLAQMDVSFRAIHSGCSHQESTVKTIQDQLMNAIDHSLILLITWNSYRAIKFFPNKENWIIVIDEIPCVDQVHSYELSRNAEFLTQHLETEPCEFPGLYRVIPAKSRSLRILLEGKDSIDDVFRSLFSELVSGNTDTYIDRKSWEHLVSSHSDSSDEYLNRQVTFVSMLNHKLFVNTILVGAFAEHSLLLHWLTFHHGIHAVPHKDLEIGLSYGSHKYGKRAIIHYFDGINTWSKTYRNTKAPGGKSDTIDVMDQRVSELFKDRSFLVVRNKDCKWKAGGNPIQVPVVAHGLNSYRDSHAIYLSAALNRTKQHSHVLSQLGISRVMMAQDTCHLTYYQCVMRTNLRVLDSLEPVDIIVPDRSSAEFLGGILGSCSIMKIAAPIINQKTSFNQSQKDKRARAARAYEELISTKTLPNTYTYKENGSVCVERLQMLHFTTHRSVYDTDGKQYTSVMQDPQEFISFLKLQSKKPVRTKQESPLVNPSVYKEDFGSRYRTARNFNYSSFLVLDFDSGSVSKEIFIKLFGNRAPIDDRLSFVICNTFSRTQQSPNRFRVFVFYQMPAMTIDQHKSCYDYIVHKLERAGHSPVKSGLDSSSSSPIQSFYVPCTNIDHQDHAFFETHNTHTKGIQQFGLIPFFFADDEEFAAELNQENNCGEIPDDLIYKVTADVRSMREGRHLAMFIAGLRLSRLRWKGYRLSAWDIEQILLNISSEDHIKRKVAGIMRSLRNYGKI